MICYTLAGTIMVKPDGKSPMTAEFVTWLLLSPPKNDIHLNEPCCSASGQWACYLRLCVTFPCLKVTAALCLPLEK